MAKEEYRLAKKYVSLIKNGENGEEGEKFLEKICELLKEKNLRWQINLRKNWSRKLVPSLRNKEYNIYQLFSFAHLKEEKEIL